MKKTFFEKNATAIIACVLIVAALSIAWLLYTGLKNDGSSRSLKIAYTEEVARAADKFTVEPARIYAVIKVESDFVPDAVSPHGATGLMQMLPSTFEEQCQRRGEPYDPEKLKDPWVNIDYCTEYLRIIYDMTGDWDWSHLAYFAGIGNVMKWREQGLSPDEVPMDGAREYLRRIRGAYDAYRQALIDEQPGKGAGIIERINK